MIIVSALLFGVIAAGFITLMVSEMGKSGENSLSQSAYDSSLAGIEDAKVLLMKYKMCSVDMNAFPGECSKIKDAIEQKEGDCNKLGTTTGTPQDADGAYLIQEVDDGNDVTVQAYTCISIDPYPDDYLGTLSSENPTRLIPLQAKDGNNGVRYVRISWYSSDNLGKGTTSYQNSVDSNGKINFSDNASTPPIITASIYQAGNNFNLNDFSDTSGSTTNRGTLWLVPSNSGTNPLATTDPTRYSHYGSLLEKWASFGGTTQQRTTKLNSNALANSNNHDPNSIDNSSPYVTHEGYPVRCADSTRGETANLDYLCSVEIELPNPIGVRSNELGTFLLFLTMPYGQPTTDFQVQMLGNSIIANAIDAKQFNNVQTIIDSTGRANDVYARTESRIEFYNSDFPFADYALTLGNGDSDGALWKDFTTSSKDGGGCWYSTYSNSSFDAEDCEI